MIITYETPSFCKVVVKYILSRWSATDLVALLITTLGRCCIYQNHFKYCKIDSNFLWYFLESWKIEDLIWYDFYCNGIQKLFYQQILPEKREFCHIMGQIICNYFQCLEFRKIIIVIMAIVWIVIDSNKIQIQFYCHSFGRFLRKIRTKFPLLLNTKWEFKWELKWEL